VCKNEVISLARQDLHGITMRNIYRSLLLLLVGATQKELARQVRFLTIENQMLRSRLPRRLTITQQERNRLVRFGAKLGSALDHLVSIVHPDTLRRWIREDRRGRRKAPVARGRRRTPEQLRRLIIKLARETGWGYTPPNPPSSSTLPGRNPLRTKTLFKERSVAIAEQLVAGFEFLLGAARRERPTTKLAGTG
jgi:transposase-like protein